MTCIENIVNVEMLIDNEENTWIFVKSYNGGVISM